MKTIILSLLLIATLLCNFAFCGEIHQAALTGDLEKIQALLKENPDLVFSKEGHGWTPLHYAAANGYTNITEFLLANKAEVNATNNNGNTPLHMAVLNGYEGIAEILRQHGGLDANPPPPKQDVRAPVAASPGFKASTTSITSIHEAVMFDDLKDMETILKAHPDLVNANNGNHLPGITPLHLAALLGHKDALELLLENKANINAKDNAGQTALHKAAYSDHKDIAELLLAAGASVNANDINGDTPLHFAANSGCESVVEVLLAHKANVNAQDNSGNTPLHLAAWGHEDARAVTVTNGSVTPDFVSGERLVNVAKLLLANKAKVNAKNNGGGTPLFYAAFISDNTAMVKLLLDNKADVNAKTSQGVTVLYLLDHYTHQLANPKTGKLERDDRNFQDVIDLLRQYGGHE